MKKIKIIAPSNSAIDINKEIMKYGVKRLITNGFDVEFGNFIFTSKVFGMATLAEKQEDINRAIYEKVDFLLTIFGGYNSDSLLDKINYEMYNSILIGYSDTTALMNALYTKTGKKSIHGLSFAALCEPRIDRKSLELFFKVMNGECNIVMEAANYIDNDFWFMNADNIAHVRTESAGWLPLVEGHAKGVLLGGNINTFINLSGTQYFPELSEAILLFEVSPETPIKKVFSYFTHLKYLNAYKKIKGMIIGIISPSDQQRDIQLLKLMFVELEVNLNIPIIVNTNFSHYCPIYPLVIGGITEINSVSGNCYVKIIDGIK